VVNLVELETYEFDNVLNIYMMWAISSSAHTSNLNSGKPQNSINLRKNWA